MASRQCTTLYPTYPQPMIDAEPSGSAATVPATLVPNSAMPGASVLALGSRARAMVYRPMFRMSLNRPMPRSISTSAFIAPGFAW